MKWSDLFRRRTDRDRFAELVMRRAKERGWTHKITYDRDDFRLDVGPKDAKLFLQNVFRDWSKADADGRPIEVDRLISTMLENDGGDDLETALPLLLPIIRNRRELESYWLDPSMGMDQGRWTGAYRPLCEALAVDPVEPELEPLRDLRAKQALWDYDAQREMLQAHCERTNRDVFVASILASRYDGCIYGIATWGDGVRTLLPRTDAIAIFRGERHFVRRWDDFWSVCGDVLVEEGLYPHRYLTPDVLDGERLDRLERAFASPDWLPPPKESAQLNRRG